MSVIHEVDPIIPYTTSRYAGRHASECPVKYLLALLHNVPEEEPFTEELRAHLATRQDEVDAAMDELARTMSENQLQTSV
jgi:hypothetical protein